MINQMTNYCLTLYLFMTNIYILYGVFKDGSKIKTF